MIKPNKEITIDFLKKYTEVTNELSNKIYKTLLTVVNEKYNNIFLDFKVANISFCNNTEKVYVTILVKKPIKDLVNFGFKKIVIPYKHLTTKNKLLKKNLENINKRKENTKEEYEMYLKLKRKYEREFEKCIICGKLTDEYTTTHIECRNNYVEEMGQLCSSCYSKYVIK